MQEITSPDYVISNELCEDCAKGRRENLDRMQGQAYRFSRSPAFTAVAFPRNDMGFLWDVISNEQGWDGVLGRGENLNSMQGRASKFSRSPARATRYVPSK